jgi:hypothetical protein
VLGYCKTYQDGEKEVLCDYLYQLGMRKTTSDCALMNIFNAGCVSSLPLGTFEKLGNANKELSLSFLYGDDDWARYADEDFSKKVTSKTGQYIICPTCSHQLAMDNPIGMSNSLTNCFLDKNLPVLPT